MLIPGDVEQDRHGPFLQGSGDKQEEQTVRNSHTEVRRTLGHGDQTQPGGRRTSLREDKTFKLRCRNEKELARPGWGWEGEEELRRGRAL